MNVKIGCSNYKLIDSPDLIRKELKMGMIMYNEKEIHIQNGYPQETREQVLLHEVVHGMLSETGEKDLAENEQFVELMSRQLFTFIKENDLDKVFSFLKEGEQP